MPPTQMARRAFPVSGTGLCPPPVVLIKLYLVDVGHLDFFFFKRTGPVTLNQSLPSVFLIGFFSVGGGEDGR